MLRDRAGLPEDERAALERALASQKILADVVRWCAGRGTPIADVITQDEYTHDIVVPYRDALHLVYDTT